MKLTFRAGCSPLQHLLDQINATTRSISFIPQQLIGRTGGRAKTTVHATTQDVIGFLPFRCFANEVGQMGLHGSPVFVHATTVENTPRIKRPLQIDVYCLE